MPRLPVPMTNRRWIVFAVVVALLAAAATVFVVRRLNDGPDTRLAKAMALAPDDAVRFSWTDWAAVRKELDATVTASTSGQDLKPFLDDAFDADLSPMTSLLASTEVLQDQYGFSPATLDWELYTQSDAGAVLLLGLPDGLDLSDLRASLERVGYPAPTSEGGVWAGGPDLMAKVGNLTPELSYLTIDATNRVLAASDQQTSLTRWRKQQRADAATDSASSPDGSSGGIDQAVDALGEVTAAAVYGGTYACTALAMTQAAPEEQAAADELLAKSGKVTAYDAYAIGTRADGQVRVAMVFEDPDRAHTNADSRAALAAGPAAGQGGNFADRFAVESVTADEDVLTIRLKPTKGAYVLSEFSAGPVLFATC